MNKSSIFSIITFIFVSAMALLIFAFLMFFLYEKDKFVNTFTQKYEFLAHIVSQSNPQNSIEVNNLVSKLEKFNMEFTFNKDIIKIAKDKPKSISDNLVFFEHNEKLYFLVNYPNKSFLFIDHDYTPYDYYKIMILFAFTVIILLFSYYLILNILRPIKTLTKNVEKFAHGDFDVLVNTVGQNEIADLTKAFNRSVTQIQKLNDSRRLFLRNIMHELKTPITKGKLLLSLPHNETNTERLNNVFLRLQDLIEEFALIEQYSSGLLEPNTKEHTFEHLFHTSLQIAMLQDEGVIIQGKISTKFKVDEKLFAIAIKNMIDNALKYSTDHQVTIHITDHTLDFINTGEKLNQDLKFFIMPFSKGSTNNPNSMGLGLYIVNSILKAHNIELRYKYQDNRNIFSFVFPKNL